MESKKPWYVYVIRCADNSLYTGITTDINRRFKEHVSEKTGAKYTRGRKPVAVVYEETYTSRGEAQAREIAIKRLPKVKKEHLITK